jgi:hypothetical protein
LAHATHPPAGETQSDEVTHAADHFQQGGVPLRAETVVPCKYVRQEAWTFWQELDQVLVRHYLDRDELAWREWVGVR